MSSEKLLNTRDAARYLCVGTSFLERDRWIGASVPCIRVGTRAVRYRLSDLDAIIAARRTATGLMEPAIGFEPTTH